MANSRDFQEALRKMISLRGDRSRLGAADARPPIVSAIGVGTQTETATGGGIASPLIERADTRQFHAQDLTSPDGLFVLENLVPSVMDFIDGDGNAVQIQYDNPYD